MAKGRKTGGRKKGTPNKITRDLAAMIDGALEAVGGQDYLERQAEENPVAFMALVGKRLPKDVNLGGELGVMRITLNGKGVRPRAG